MQGLATGPKQQWVEAPGLGRCGKELAQQRQKGINRTEPTAELGDRLGPMPGLVSLQHHRTASQVQAIGEWRERFQHNVNDGVYRCGFARNQGAYDRAEAALFETLAEAEALLSRPDASPWLCGRAPSLADVQLFPTLIRLELVYAPLFGVSRQPLWHFPGLWRWRQRFFALAGVAETCCEQAWREDYFGALFPLNPSGIVPAGPALSTLVQGAA